MRIPLIKKERVRPPDESDVEYRERILAQMDDSQTRAITVALASLGYEMVPTDVIVVETADGLPADGVLLPGDSIRTLDGEEIIASTDVTAALEGRAPGESITIGLVREGEPMEVRLDLAAREDDPTAPMIGVVIRQIAEPPFPVSIEGGVIRLEVD